MTDRDRLYISACKLPPSPERTEILETIVRVERLELMQRRARRKVPSHMVVVDGQPRTVRTTSKWTPEYLQ